jgi:hypothetical protein
MQEAVWARKSGKGEMLAQNQSWSGEGLIESGLRRGASPPYRRSQPLALLDSEHTHAGELVLFWANFHSHLAEACVRQ